MRTPFVVVAAVLAVACAAASGCKADSSSAPASSSQASTSGLPDRDPALAHRLVAAGGVLLDVRSAREYADRHVDGAVNIPVGDLQTRMRDVETLTAGDKRRPIVVYCAAGLRAAQAKKILVAGGYEQVTNLGGIDDWDRR